jgi:hypothetical protein
MDYTKVKAIEVDLNINTELMRQEFFSIPEDSWQVNIASNLIGTGTHVYKSLFLTKNNIAVFTDFKNAKKISHTDWYWDENFNLPYTRSVINSLPAKSIGMVRIMIADGPLPLHTDCDKETPQHYSYRLGLTIAPIQTQKMQLGENKIAGNQYFFNDSIPHGFPESIDMQISVRVFGEFEYDKFNITKIYK